ncbi:hypothetical protein DPMN_115805 [Dreissena polymorpha]|uniref:Uncharacterized protein n=1 Tax=Dreissena polymorpha TaxID=45954 RepID=A0A9D4QTA3_DREPO|nr:hypothetical protein DPMN_115805 [Dreissena polymorpha]
MGSLARAYRATPHESTGQSPNMLATCHLNRSENLSINLRGPRVKRPTQILRNLQKMASEVERITGEMSRQNRLQDKQTDLLYRITKGVLQIRDDLNQKESQGKSASYKKCGKICKDMTFSEYSSY